MWRRYTRRAGNFQMLASLLMDMELDATEGGRSEWILLRVIISMPRIPISMLAVEVSMTATFANR